MQSRRGVKTRVEAGRSCERRSCAQSRHSPHLPERHRTRQPKRQLEHRTSCRCAVRVTCRLVSSGRTPVTGEQELSIPAATSLISFTSYQQLEPGDWRRSLLRVPPDLRRWGAIETPLLVPIGRSPFEKNAKSPVHQGDPFDGQNDHDGGISRHRRHARRPIEDRPDVDAACAQQQAISVASGQRPTQSVSAASGSQTGTVHRFLLTRAPRLLHSLHPCLNSCPFRGMIAWTVLPSRSDAGADSVIFNKSHFVTIKTPVINPCERNLRRGSPSASAS